MDDIFTSRRGLLIAPMLLATEPRACASSSWP
jgi:hypothetical protein